MPLRDIINTEQRSTYLELSATRLVYRKQSKSARSPSTKPPVDRVTSPGHQSHNMSPQQVHNNTVHLLPLKDDGSPDLPGDPPYIYLPPPTTPAYSVRFEIEGTSSICRQGSLWVNIPGKHDQFDRKKFKEYKCVSIIHVYYHYLN